MRITVRVVLAEKQHITLAHEIYDLWISLEYTQAGKVFDLIRESAGVINRTIDIESVLFSDYKIVVAMTGRRMDQTGAGLAGSRLLTRFTDVQFGFRVGLTAQGDVFGHHEKRSTINPR